MAVKIIGTAIILVAGITAIYCIYKFIVAMLEVDRVHKSLHKFVEEGRKQYEEERKRWEE